MDKALVEALTMIVKTLRTFISCSSINVQVRHNDNPPNIVGGGIMWEYNVYPAVSAYLLVAPRRS